VEAVPSKLASWVSSVADTAASAPEEVNRNRALDEPSSTTKSRLAPAVYALVAEPIFAAALVVEIAPEMFPVTITSSAPGAKPPAPATLAELSTKQVAEKDQAVGYPKNAHAAKKGGRYAGKARKDFEKLTGKPVVSEDNFLPPAKSQNLIK